MRKRLRWSGIVGALALLVTGVMPGLVTAATTGKIVGRVTDDSGAPLPGVAIAVEGLRLGATTGSDGLYFILQVPPGTHTVEASLIGYQAIRQQGVQVNIDRTTDLNFSLRESAIEVEAVTVTAERPVVQLDVTSTQISISSEDANTLPVASMVEAIGFQAGIDVQNVMTISVRGSMPDELSFMVDGFEQTNPVQNRSYTTMNKELVQEVQILTGAFTAEYFARAAVVNVATITPAAQPTLSGDVRWAPAQKKHFGPGAYDDDEFDRLLYMSLTNTDTRDKSQRFYAADGNPIINSNDAVYYSRTDTSAKGELAFIGWDALLTKVNGGTYTTQDPVLTANAGNWTKAALLEYWEYQHRGNDYGTDGDDDYVVDLAVTAPIPGARTGIVFGYHDMQQAYAVPASVPNFNDRKFDLTVKSQIIPDVKFEVLGFYETVSGCMAATGITSDGNVGAHDPQLFFSTFEGSNRGTSLYNTYLNTHATLTEGGQVNKYYVAGNTPYVEDIWGIGASITHTPNPAFFYTLSYNHVAGSVNARNQWDDYRDLTATHALTALGADGSTIHVGAEAPTGWVPSEGLDWGGSADVTNSYLFTGGGYVTDFSVWSYDRFRIDAFSQLNQNHGVKAGAELILNDLNSDIRRFSRSFGRLADFGSVWEAEPWQVGFYLQDKAEYEGLIVNAGLRLDGYNAGYYKYYPDELVPIEFRKGGLANMLTTAGVKVYDATYERNLSWQYTPLSEWQEYQDHKRAMAVMPREEANTFWKLQPRLGIAHPVGTSTKFFFNFGWTYSLPKAGYRYGFGTESFLLVTTASEVRGMSNANVDMPRSVLYEVGFEQSLRNTYLFRIKGYSRDDDNIPGAYTGVGYDEATQLTHSMTLVGNNRFQTSRGMEITTSKMSGRFWTASMNVDFRVVSSGQKGYATVYHEGLNQANAPFRITSGQSQIQPKFDAMVGFHTPRDYGDLKGNWHLTIRQAWQRGDTYDYDPTGTGIPVTLRWVDYWRTDLRLSKDVFLGSRSVSFYMDVRNVLNNRRINLSALEVTPGGRYVDYMDLLIEADPSTGLYKATDKIGDSKFDDIVRERIVQDNDWLLYAEQPRFFQFGMRINL